MSSMSPRAKAKLELDRASKPEDSTQRARDHAAVVFGQPVETILRFEELLAKTGLEESDRQNDGGYAFKKGTVDARLFQKGSDVSLHITTTRPEKPVHFGLHFSVADDGGLRLKHAFAKHANPDLDDQHVNNPAMLEFALSKVHEEVKLVKNPVWWVGTLKAYDAAHGSDYAGKYIREKLDGKDPMAAVIHGVPSPA